MNDIFMVVPAITYRFICMRRCGHHAIMRWLYHQLEGTKIYRNDVTTRKDGLTDEFLYYLDGLEFNKNKIKQNNGKLICDNFMFNHEDEDPFKALDRQLTTKSKVFNIIVMRDIKNLFASRLKCQFVDNTKKSFLESLELYKKYESICTCKNVYLINYNKWFVDIDYRKQIANELGVTYFNDGEFNNVPSAGGGSSFDKREFNKRASEMDVLNRWKEFENHEWFKEYIK